MIGYPAGSTAATYENMKQAQRSMVDALAAPSLSGSYANLQSEVSLLAGLVERMESVASSLDGAPAGPNPPPSPYPTEPRSALEKFAQAVAELASLRARLEDAQQRIVLAL